MLKKLCSLMLFILLVLACKRENIPVPVPRSSPSPVITSAVTGPTSTAASTPGTLSPSTTSVVDANVSQTLSPSFWEDLPVVPSGISDRAYEIYRHGLQMGNNPNAFSKVGDCHSTNPYFLRDYDLGPAVYNLGDFSYLQDTITYFQDSFARPSLAAKKGLSTAGVLAPLWADWKYCSSNETPLDCEYRIHRPSFAIISLGTNEAYDVKKDRSTFEGRLRRIIEHSIDQGVVPILSTKADNDEGNNFINYVTARLAAEYQLPLWNFWRAVQPLPQHGMRSSDHLTFAPTNSFTDFSSPVYLEYGMQVRNLTALQVLDMIRRALTSRGSTVSTTPPITDTAAAPPSAHDAGETTTSTVDGMKMVYIPAGEFEMGSSQGNANETPVHTVALTGYWLDSTEVTQEMFAAFLNSSGNQSEGGVNWLNTNEPFVWVFEKSNVWRARSEMKNYPIVGISWYGANAYCQWAGRQLPTEAQWEFAAKSENANRFPWGNESLDCDHARFSGCGNLPVEVYSLPLGKNQWGIYGLAGNVAEWVNDRYGADYYSESTTFNPTGPLNGYYRVVRGGFWGSVYIALQTSHRDWQGADTRESSIGFRCALNP